MSRNSTTTKICTLVHYKLFNFIIEVSYFVDRYFTVLLTFWRPDLSLFLPVSRPLGLLSTYHFDIYLLKLDLNVIQNAAEEVGEHFLRETLSVCVCGDVKEEIYFFHKVRPEKEKSS